MNTSEALLERARRVIPGGVSSPVRAFTAVGGSPRFVARAQGSRIWDVDGREYIDLVGGWGPMILGHAAPPVVAAINRAAEGSVSFGAPCENEVLLAEEIAVRIAPAERVRFTNSGTEAVMTAIRLTRAATERTLIVKFSGCYHGHADSLLASAGSGLATLGLPGSPGVPAGVAADTIVLPYADPAALEGVFALHGDRIAAVITEAVPANMGVVPPPTGFNEHLRKITSANGSLMILDEVLTGFRATALGGWGLDGAIEGWQPDLLAFGKVVGGGLPLAAIAGSADVMDLLAPVGPVYQAGTLSGNPTATAAGLATLHGCTDDVYRTLEQRSESIQGVVSSALTSAGVPHRVQRAGTLFSVFWMDEAATDFASAQRQDTDLYRRFFHAMLDEGIWLPPSAFEAWFVSSAHSAADIDRIAEATSSALRRM